jgi:hypothetical protein
MVIHSWIDYVIYRKMNVAVVTVVGKPDLRQYLDIVDRLESDESYSRELNRLCDFTDSSEVGLSTVDILKFAQRLQTMPISHHTRTALVTHRNKTWSFLFMLITKIARGEYKLFEDYQSAKSWLGMESLSS